MDSTTEHIAATTEPRNVPLILSSASHAEKLPNITDPVSENPAPAAESGDNVPLSRPSSSGQGEQILSLGGNNSGALTEQRHQLNTLTPIDPPDGQHPNAKPFALDLIFLVPLIVWNTLALISTCVVLFRAGSDSQYNSPYDQMRYVARFTPVIVGTVTQLASRSVFYGFARMDPYYRMADHPRVPGNYGRRTIANPYIPLLGNWFELLACRRWVRTLAMIAQITTSFISSLKSVFLSTTGTESGRWIITVHYVPSIVLIVCYAINVFTMTVILVFTIVHVTGLKWDPVTIADQVALFYHSNVLPSIRSLELEPRARAHKLLNTGSYRLGYWRHDQTGDTIYNISRLSNDLALENQPSNDEAQTRLPQECKENCDTRFCNCSRNYQSHTYPHWQSVLHAPLMIPIWSTLIWIALVACITAIGTGAYQHGFSIANTWELSSRQGNSSSRVNRTETNVPSLWALSVETSSSIVYAAIFRFVLVYFASMYAIGYMDVVDLSHRLGQPFANMFNKRATAEETVFLDYAWALPGVATIDALKKKHWKVAIFSAVNLLNPFFPILVSGLFLISDAGPSVKFTLDKLTFILVFAYLIVYALITPIAWPTWKRRILRTQYSIADLLSMCYSSRFIQDEALDISNPRITKRHMESTLFLQERLYSIGLYSGSDGVLHFGFDFATLPGKDGVEVNHISHIDFEAWKRGQRCGTMVD